MTDRGSDGHENGAGPGRIAATVALIAATAATLWWITERFFP